MGGEREERQKEKAGITARTSECAVDIQRQEVCAGCLRGSLHSSWRGAAPAGTGGRTRGERAGTWAGGAEPEPWTGSQRGSQWDGSEKQGWKQVA